MKILTSFILAMLLLIKSDKKIQEPKKVYIQSVENKIQIGPLSKNRNLVFGFKNILLENLQELDYEVTDSLSNSDYSLKVEFFPGEQELRRRSRKK